MMTTVKAADDVKAITTCEGDCCQEIGNLASKQKIEFNESNFKEVCHVIENVYVNDWEIVMSKTKIDKMEFEQENLIQTVLQEDRCYGDTKSGSKKTEICSDFVEIPLGEETVPIEPVPERNIKFKPNRDVKIKLELDITLKQEQEIPFNITTDCILNLDSIETGNDDDVNQNSLDGKHDKDELTVENQSCSDTVSLSEPCCRVCQCDENDEKLISPCLCAGSVKWIHESCLVHWMKCSFKDSCELCTKKIEIAKRRKPLSKWKLPSQRPTPVLWVLVFVTAIALNLASVVKDASRLCSSTPCLVFYAVGCIGVILGTLFLIYWSKRARSFINHWLEQNEEWIVVLGENEKRSKPLRGDSKYCSSYEENRIL